jgi:hypothetical protein
MKVGENSTEGLDDLVKKKNLTSTETIDVAPEENICEFKVKKRDACS